MPLTTYAPGDVLTAASLNANLVFAAANPTGGLTFLSAGTFTTATSSSLPTNTFSATYRNYKVVYNVTVATASVALTLRLRTAGTDNTASSYVQGAPGHNSNGSAANIANNSTSSLTVGTTFSGALSQVAISLDVLNPQATEKTFGQGFYTFIDTNGYTTGVATGILFNATTSFDSMTLISSVASSITGVFRVYGYADS